MLDRLRTYQVYNSLGRNYTSLVVSQEVLTYMSLGRRIRQLRKQSGWFQKELAERIQSSVQAISNWEQNRAVPDSTNRRKLAQAFNITEADLFMDSSVATADPIRIILQQAGYAPDDLSGLGEEDWKIIQSVVSPLIEQLLQRRTDEKSAPDKPPHLSTIFIIDDEVKLCQALAVALRSRGFTVDFAFNGQAALEKLLIKQEKPDLILLDLRMPIINGEQFLQQLRKVNTTSKIIVMTGYPQDVVDLHANNLRIEGYFEKPFAMTAIVEKVEELLK